METRLIWVIAQRELREALGNKWLWFYTIGFAGLAITLSQAGLSTAGYAGLGGFGRTAASLINALLLFVPLIGLTVGAGTLAADRERGTLLYLLAQPISRAELFGGKAVGATLAVATTLGLGFGLAGLVLASAGDNNPFVYLNLAAYALLLALACLGIGFVISAISRKGAAASGAALLVWLGLVFLGDLGLVGATLAYRPAPSALLGLLFLNPLQVFKMAAIYSLRSTLDTLGPVGHYAVYRFADTLPLLFLAGLILWIGLTFASSFTLFQRRGDL